MAKLNHVFVIYKLAQLISIHRLEKQSIREHKTLFGFA
jgi:hypothetical protein